MRHPFLLSLLSVPLLAAPPARAQMAAPAVLPPVVSTQTAAVPGLMDALLKQKISPQDLWEGGQLNADSLTAVLNEQPWGRTENQPLASQLCAMIVEKTPEKLKTPLALPPRVRLRLAQYFARLKDARAVTFYEAILSLIKTPREAGVREVFDLSDYYTSIGDWEKAAETRLRMKDYTTAEPYLANANLEAARMYVEHGKLEMAEPLYQRAENSSYGWASGLAFLDHGRALMAQLQYEEAIKVLSTPISGQYADQIEPIKRMLIGDIYYAEGDLTKARENMQAAIAAHNAVQNPLQGEGLENIFASAEKRLELMDQWIKEPIQVDTKKIHILVNEKQLQKGPVIRRLRVRTYRDVPLVATTDNRHVAAQIISVNEWSELSEVHRNEISEKEVIIKVISLPQDDSKTLLNISSERYAEFQTHVTVYLELSESKRVNEKQ